MFTPCLKFFLYFQMRYYIFSVKTCHLSERKYTHNKQGNYGVDPYHVSLHRMILLCDSSVFTILFVNTSCDFYSNTFYRKILRNFQTRGKHILCRVSKKVYRVNQECLEIDILIQ